MFYSHTHINCSTGQGNPFRTNTLFIPSFFILSCSFQGGSRELWHFLTPRACWWTGPASFKLRMFYISIFHLSYPRHLRYFGEKAFFLYLPCAAFLDLLVMLMVAVLMKWIVLGRVKPGPRPARPQTFVAHIRTV